SVVAVAIVWQWMYHPDFGLINNLLTRAGLGPVNWLGDPKTALVATMLVSVWMQLGYQLTVFLAGLRAIPQSYLDAARVDGANAWQRFWRVTFPLLSPVTLFVLVTGMLGAFQVLPLACVMIAPFLYMVATALMSEPGSLRHPVSENFAAALVAVPFARFLMNSVIFSLAVVAGQVLTSATAAYAFARLRFPGRDRLFLAYLCALMAPAIVLVIPRFLLIDAFGWVDSYHGLISTELVSVSGIFLLRQFFRTIPRDLEDAARLEGAGE